MISVYTYGNGEMLGNLFQVVAAITGGGDMLEAVRIAFLISSFVVAVEMALTASLKPAPRVLIFILMFNVLLLTKEDVQIEDRIDVAASTSVSNVPVGLAYLAAYSSAFGDWLTQRFETNFALPGDVQYTKNGFMFASRLVEASNEFQITDSRFAANLSEFLTHCVYYGTLVGWYDLDKLLASGDLWREIRAVDVGNAIYIKYDNEMMGCQDAKLYLTSDWMMAEEEMETVFGLRLFPGANQVDARARLLAALPGTYQHLAGISESAANIIQQAAMVNAMKRELATYAAEANATAALQDYSLAVAEEQQRNTYQTTAALVGRNLVLMHNIFEVFTYGIFPLFLLLLFLSREPGKFFLFYVKLVFWVQLWAPMFAILHFVMVGYAAKVTTAAAMQPVGAGVAAVFSMLTSSGMNQVNADVSAMAGYLITLIPVLAYQLVQGGGSALASAAGGLTSVASSAAGAAASEATRGNINLGQFGMFNSSMWQRNHNPSWNEGVGSYTDPMTGARIATTAGGSQYTSIPQSDGPLSIDMTSAIRSGVNTMAASSLQSASANSVDYATQVGAAWRDISGFASTLGKGTNVNRDWMSGEGTQFGRSYGEMKKLLDSFNAGVKLDESQKAAFLAGVQANAEAGLEIPFVAKSKIAAEAGLKLGDEAAINKAWDAAQKFNKENNFGEKWDSFQKASKQATASYGKSHSDQKSDQLSASLDRLAQHGHRVQASLTDAKQWQEAASRLNEQGFATKSAGLDGFKRWFLDPKKGGGTLDGFNRLIAGANNSDPSAMNALYGRVSEKTGEREGGLLQRYAQEEGLKLAGIRDAPGKDGVARHYEQNSAAVDAQGDKGVAAADDANREKVDKKAEQNGVPSFANIEGEARDIRNGTEGRMNTQDLAIFEGRGNVEDRGWQLENAVSKSVDNKLLAGLALQNARNRVLAFVPDTATRLFGEGSELDAAGKAYGQSMIDSAKAKPDGPKAFPTDWTYGTTLGRGEGGSTDGKDGKKE